ncbi:hypothetical protein [Pseudoalteromonas carrageenovora]|nr:hypothetical protein [Pseudoalteromonas carrageenovora]MDO6547239.1 hypothetical protein [Pseudoalteromonas carrageenovora]MDO6831687.1 hypothetical protein [Pseudoalteromonas carrageenovora]MDO6834397.1 hypothetical protein [Pseudoalteromonas carrageenovora]
MNAVFKTKRLLLRYANEHDAAMLLTLVNQSFTASHKHQGSGPYDITYF